MPEPITDIVNVQINLESSPLSGEAFGTTLVLSRDNPITPWGMSEVIRFYDNLDAVEEDFEPGSDTLEAATAYFSQSPTPVQMAVGMGSSPDGLDAFTITVNSAIAAHVYKATINGFFGSYTATHIGTGGDSPTSIAAALSAQLNSEIAATNDATLFTVTPTLAVITVDCAIQGVHFSIVNGSVGGDLSIVQTFLSTGALEDLQAILTAGHTGDWYGVLYADAQSINGTKQGDILALAPFVEGLLPRHVLFVQVDDAAAKTSSGAIASDFLFLKAFLRSPWIYTEDPTAYPNASLAALFAATQPGKINANLKKLPGVTPDNLTASAIASIQAFNGNYYTQIVSGSSSLNGVISGKCPNGQSIKNMVGCDFLANSMTVQVLNYLASQDDVPYTDAGISAVANIIKGWLTFGVNILLLTNDPRPVINQTPASQVSAALVAEGLVDSTVVSFQAFLAGSINAVQITGTVSFAQAA